MVKNVKRLWWMEGVEVGEEWRQSHRLGRGSCSWSNRLLVGGSTEPLGPGVGSARSNPNQAIPPPPLHRRIPGPSWTDSSTGAGSGSTHSDDAASTGEQSKTGSVEVVAAVQPIWLVTLDHLRTASGEPTGPPHSEPELEKFYKHYRESASALYPANEP